MPEEARQTVKKRQMFYIPGYDPVPPRRYRELYRKEGAEQAEISGYRFEMKPKARDVEVFGWGAETEIDGQKTHTQIQIMFWADIVQSSMDQNIPRTYLLLLRTAWEYIGTGALFGLMKLRIGPILAALYPVAMLLLQLLVACLLAWAAYYLSNRYLHWVPGLIAVPFIVGGFLWWFKRKDAHLFAYYLMHAFYYCVGLRVSRGNQLKFDAILFPKIPLKEMAYKLSSSVRYNSLRPRVPVEPSYF